MDLKTRIKLKEHKLVHGRNKHVDVYSIADRLNKSYSQVCRMSSLDEDQPFDVANAIVVMNLKKDYDLLKQICLECGFVAVQIPKSKLSKGDEHEIISKMQSVASSVTPALIEFFKEPTEDNYSAVKDALYGNIRESVSVEKYVDKKAQKQMDLGL